MVRWVIRSILHGVDPLSYFLFQPVLHDCCNKGRVCIILSVGMMHIKIPLLLIGKSSLCGRSGFPLSLSELPFTICSNCFLLFGDLKMATLRADQFGFRFPCVDVRARFRSYDVISWNFPQPQLRNCIWRGSEMYVRGKSVRSWCDGSSYRSFIELFLAPRLA